MSDTDAPILVVDDAKFSSAIIAKILRGGGYANVRFTNNPQEALRSLEKHPAQLVLADWLMPAMDGTELTRRIRRLDVSTNHYTHIMLMTARDEVSGIADALEIGVDDFISKANIRTQLSARVMAAIRAVKIHNELLHANHHLSRKIKELQTTDLVDPVTGLGNLSFTLERITATLTQTEARGGAACLLLVGLKNLQALRNQYDTDHLDELFGGIGAKLRGLVRPLDLVTRPAEHIFAATMLQPSVEHCTAHSFRRVFDNLYMHSFKTDAGFIPVVVGVSITAASEATGFPNAKDFYECGKIGLDRSFESGAIHVASFDPAQLMNIAAAP